MSLNPEGRNERIWRVAEVLYKVGREHLDITLADETPWVKESYANSAAEALAGGGRSRLDARFDTSWARDWPLGNPPA